MDDDGRRTVIFGQTQPPALMYRQGIKGWEPLLDPKQRLVAVTQSFGTPLYPHLCSPRPDQTPAEGLTASPLCAAACDQCGASYQGFIAYREHLADGRPGWVCLKCSGGTSAVPIEFDLTGL